MCMCVRVYASVFVSVSVYVIIEFVCMLKCLQHPEAIVNGRASDVC